MCRSMDEDIQSIMLKVYDNFGDISRHEPQAGLGKHSAALTSL